MIKIYTAITGGYEQPRNDIEVYTEQIMSDPKKSSLFYKAITPDFDKYEYSIWMDGNTSLKVDPEYLIDKYLKNASFNRLWWEEICKGSRRDQLSFDYSLWKMEMKANWFEVDNFDSHKINPYFNYVKHNEIQRQSISSPIFRQSLGNRNRRG